MAQPDPAQSERDSEVERIHRLMEASTDDVRPWCSQTTVRGGWCSHRATWTEVRQRTGDREYYCTLHANKYMPWRRGGERIA